jgi:hypothetical protein
LLQDVFKDRKIGRIGVFAGEDRDHQHCLFPFRVETELGLQMSPLLAEDMEGGDSAALLRKLGNGTTPYASWGGNRSWPSLSHQGPYSQAMTLTETLFFVNIGRRRGVGLSAANFP